MIKKLVALDFGWPTPSDRKPLERLLQTGQPDVGPHVTPNLLDPNRPLKVFHSCGDMGRAAWHQSVFFNDYVKDAHLDDMIHTHHLSDSGQMRWLHVHRAQGDAAFTKRDRRLLALLNMEVSELLGAKLAPLGTPGVNDLPNRLRDVLLCLMKGDSEKQAARRLTISRHTVHDYVKSLHAHFGVHSRGELLARCRSLWPVLLRDIEDHRNGPSSQRIQP